MNGLSEFSRGPTSSRQSRLHEPRPPESVARSARATGTPPGYSSLGWGQHRPRDGIRGIHITSVQQGRPAFEPSGPATWNLRFFLDWFEGVPPPQPYLHVVGTLPAKKGQASSTMCCGQREHARLASSEKWHTIPPSVWRLKTCFLNGYLQHHHLGPHEEDENPGQFDNAIELADLEGRHFRLLDSAHGNLSHTAAATSGMKAICRCTGNNNLEPILPFVVKIEQTLTKICFLCRVWSRPPLLRASRVLLWSQRLRDKVKQTWCLIVDNMFKFVDVRAAVRTLILKLEPLVRAACEKVSKFPDREI